MKSTSHRSRVTSHAFAAACQATLVLVFAAGTCAAQSYPAKPIRIIVPFPAGGIADLFGRVIGQRFNEAWGQPAVVENRPGAGGNIGAEVVAKSPPDGYTLVTGSIGTHAVNVSLFSKLPYDPIRDFAPVSLIMEAEGLLVVHPSLPVKSVKDLIALARARPGQIAYASAGHGTAAHLSGVQKRLNAEGARFSPWTPDQFAAFVKAEMTKWAKVVKEAGIRVD